MKLNRFILFSLLVLITSYTIKAQTVAYDITFSSYNHTDCLNLSFINSWVRGHQTNATVGYYSTLIDAQNDANKLSIYYSYASSNETLYARVTAEDGSDFAISVITIALSDIPVGGPPPPGISDFYFCDLDNNGFEIAYLRDLYTVGQYMFNSMLCDLDESQILISYHLTNQDATNGTNAINEEYSFFVDTEIYCRVANTVNAGVTYGQFGLKFETCTATDDDSDGIDNTREDANRNGNIYDDDTDGDGLKNYEDNDDDGDGVLTINEDYNNNGSPLDDDTNNNNIPDFLESSVTLSAEGVIFNGFQILENPANISLRLQFTNSSDEKMLSIINITGKIVYQAKSLEESQEYNISFLPSGLYFVSVEVEESLIIKKFIKK
ncbi:T9SS type A sorting domain-containing protein [Winogradskyella sp.]|uniref:T9SS type A sorting domain-containing protein n=1 Tax=Winogradskyella sp. TaxID=1883156 RepID=UPI0025D4110D|nr:T9SS type A sorting domain-containing protein [Winogradskyella sp.]